MAANRYDMQKKEIEQTTKFADTAAQKRNDATNAYTNSLDDVYGAAIKNQEQATDYQIQATNQDYQIGYDNAAIQAEINKRQVANAMANAGLTNSGLNRTQQTAIQTAKSNQENALTQQKTAAVSSLRQQLNDYKAQINSQVAQAKADAIYNSNMQNANSYENWMATGYQQGNANFENDRTFAEQQRQHDDQMALSRDQLAFNREQLAWEKDQAEKSALAAAASAQSETVNNLASILRDTWQTQYSAFKERNPNAAFQYSDQQRDYIYETIYNTSMENNLDITQREMLAHAAGIDWRAYKDWESRQPEDGSVIPPSKIYKN